MVTWSTSIPRSARSSSTSRYDRPKRRYQRTASTITSGGKRKPAKADRGTAVGRERRVLMPTASLLRRGHSQCNSALPLRRPDRLAGLLARDARLGAQAAQLRADQHPADGRTTPRSRLSLGHHYLPQPGEGDSLPLRPDCRDLHLAADGCIRTRHGPDYPCAPPRTPSIPNLGRPPASV